VCVCVYVCVCAVIMFCCWTGIILVRLYQFYSADVPCWAVATAQNLLNLQGFWNSLVFAKVSE
jgi:hypothetical protein